MEGLIMDEFEQQYYDATHTNKGTLYARVFKSRVGGMAGWGFAEAVMDELRRAETPYTDDLVVGIAGALCFKHNKPWRASHVVAFALGFIKGKQRVEQKEIA